MFIVDVLHSTSNGSCAAEFSNFNIEDIITPVNPQVLENLLTETGYDVNETQFLVNGFRHGFDLEYQGSMLRQDVSNNIPLQVGSTQELWDKIMKEVKLKTVAGPFDSVLLQYFIQSPIGLVLKGVNQTRLIFHLSYDFPKSGQPSVNACTPHELCSVQYRDLDFAIKCCFKWCLTASDGTRLIRFSKLDVKSAFCLVPLNKRCWPLVVFKALDPESKKIKWFFDKVLPFGASISCSHFQRFSSAIRHIIEV